jgi:hypothetical protein
MFVCLALAVFVSCASALECFECADKGKNNDCMLMGEEFNADAINTTVCPEPTQNQTGRAVCGKTITVYESFSGSGYIASRYCDIVDTADSCSEKYGGPTSSTASCVCSDDDLCNAAVPTTIISTATLAAALLLAGKLM